jgi:hypothetical protein
VRDALQAEAALLSEAFTLVRRGHDLPRARALLERHAREFPRGPLADEARRVRARLERARLEHLSRPHP